MEIQVEYTEDLLKKAAWRIAPHFAKPIIYYSGFLIILGVSLVFFQSFLSNFGYSALILGILLMSIGILLTYFRTVRNSLPGLRKMTNPVVTFSLNEEGVVIRSELADSTVKWKLFQALRCFEEVWLIFPNKPTFHILPTEQLTPEIRELILRKMREHNIKVSGKIDGKKVAA